ncbi:MAG TPA: nickel pincer cofactor biosynthesis protein LarC [Planctomycetota bacterium]|nr:nickel pincer cofactor biosynthesis protein LarC [Planctomycetota bacterium]
MIKIAYFDCFSGASGDMILGALVDAGLRVDDLRAELARLPLTGYSLSAEKVSRAGIAATKVNVIVEHHHDHGHGHHGRHLPEILELIGGSSLPERVKRDASAVFERLAAAEGEVHGKPPDEIHFHEVGAVDSIVDIVGVAAGLHLLGVEHVYSSAIRTGTGTVKCAHGELPVPAPATARLIRGLPVVQTEIEAELTTPSGAAILATLAQAFGPMPACTIDAVGYGAGTREIAGRPNVLRVFIAQMAAGVFEADIVEVVEANLDDMSPEFFGGIFERLFAAGALDVSVIPVLMKKGRPGFLLSVIAPAGGAAGVEQILFRETTTFGVRIFEARRKKLAREHREVQTPFGSVRLKIGTLAGKIVRAKPEHDDCVRLAEAANAAFIDVHDAALKAFWSLQDNDRSI